MFLMNPYVKYMVDNNSFWKFQYRKYKKWRPISISSTKLSIKPQAGRPTTISFMSIKPCACGIFPNRRDTSARRPVLILPPQAGHHSDLADYSPAQSLVRVFHAYGYDVYVAEWMSATREYKDLGIDDYIRLTDEAVEEIRRRTDIYKIHLVGQCQGGWQAAIYTALFQDKIASLLLQQLPLIWKQHIRLSMIMLKCRWPF